MSRWREKNVNEKELGYFELCNFPEQTFFFQAAVWSMAKFLTASQVFKISSNWSSFSIWKTVLSLALLLVKDEDGHFSHESKGINKTIN